LLELSALQAAQGDGGFSALVFLPWASAIPGIAARIAAIA
jgi:hypothetical protein